MEAVPTVILFEKGKVTKRLDGRFGVGLTEKQLDNWLQTTLIDEEMFEENKP